jgi:hypothetical protein
VSDMRTELAKIIANGLVDNTMDKCSRWAEQRVVMPAPFRGAFNFENFPWQREILDCRSPMVSIRKGAQIGFSVAGMVKALHTLDVKKEDVLYILPTAQQASVFAQSRLDSIINMSPKLSDLFQAANSVGLKKTKHFSNLFIRGSVSESGLVSVPVSTVVIDEYDRCNVKALSLAMERMSSFEEKTLFALSTPTLPEFGVDGLYRQGTQEEFMFKCPSCSKTIALRWPESFEVRGDCATDERVHDSYIKCYECQAKLPHQLKRQWLKDAQWQATAPAHGHRSFGISQLYAMALTPGELAIGYHRGVGDEIAAVEFFNQKLGIPYIMKGGQVTDVEIEAAIGSHLKGSHDVDGKMIAMGIDVGSFLDVAICEYTYDEDPWLEPHLRSTSKILYEGRLAGGDFKGLEQFMTEYQVRHACIDFQPETNLAKAFARKFHGFVSLVQYRQGTEADEIKEKEDNDRIPILTVNRTAFLDYSIGRLHKPGKLILPSDVSGVWREHIKAPCRTYVLDTMGKPVATYLSNKPDHSCHALALCEVAHIKAYEQSFQKTVKM